MNIMLSELLVTRVCNQRTRQGQLRPVLRVKKDELSRDERAQVVRVRPVGADRVAAECSNTELRFNVAQKWSGRTVGT